MFENFVLEKIEKERGIINKLLESATIEGIVMKPDILNSELSDFTKNYLLNDIGDKVNTDDFEAKIEKSNKLYFNYAIRPKWTLLTFLFNNFESRPPNEIIKKLTLFPFYLFYVDAINNFIKEHSPIFCTRGEVKGIIEETDKVIYGKLTSDINNVKIKNLLIQIFKLKYRNEEEINLESAVPYAFVKIFFDDKSFPEIIKKFKIVKELNDEYEISLKDIIKVLTDKYLVPEKESIEIKQPPVKENIEVKQPEEKAEADSKKILLNIEHGKIKIKNDAEEKLNKNEPFKTTESTKKIETSKNKLQEPLKPKPMEKIYSEQLAKASEIVKEKAEEKKSEEVVNSRYNLKDLFNEKLLEKITERVYGSDLIHREKSFSKLSHFKTWFEASNHLKEIFKANSVDIFNKDVISFVDILNDYYHNKE